MQPSRLPTNTKRSRSSSSPSESAPRKRTNRGTTTPPPTSPQDDVEMGDVSSEGASDDAAAAAADSQSSGDSQAVSDLSSSATPAPNHRRGAAVAGTREQAMSSVLGGTGSTRQEDALGSLRSDLSAVLPSASSSVSGFAAPPPTPRQPSLSINYGTSITTAPASHRRGVITPPHRQRREDSTPGAPSASDRRSSAFASRGSNSARRFLDPVSSPTRAGGMGRGMIGGGVPQFGLVGAPPAFSIAQPSNVVGSLALGSGSVGAGPPPRLSFGGASVGSSVSGAGGRRGRDFAAANAEAHGRNADGSSPGPSQPARKESKKNNDEDEEMED